MLLEVNVDVHSEDLNTSNPIIQSYTLMGNFLTVHSLDHHHIISHDHTHTHTHTAGVETALKCTSISFTVTGKKVRQKSDLSLQI